MSGLAAEVGQRPRRLWLAYSSGAFGLAMIAQAGFLVPLRARELGASFDVIGLIVGAGAVAAVFASVPSGALIDRLGPKRTFVVGAGACVAVSLLFPLVTDYRWFLVLQPLLGLARNLGWVASQSYITSLGSEQERPTLTGRFSFFSNVGQMAGPLLVGAAAEVVGFRWAFLVPAAYALCFVVVGAFLVETRSPGHEQDRVPQGAGVRSAWQLLALRGIQVALLLTLGRLWISVVYATFLPVYLVDEGFDPVVVGAVVATSGLAAAVVAPTAGFWTRYVSPTTAAACALVGGAVALVLIPHVAVLPWVFVVPVLVGVGVGVSLPLLLTIVTSAAPAGRRGVALGLRSMATQMAMTAAPLVVGPLITVLGIALGFSAAGAMAAGLLVGARVLSARVGQRGRDVPMGPT